MYYNLIKIYVKYLTSFNKFVIVISAHTNFITNSLNVKLKNILYV